MWTRISGLLRKDLVQLFRDRPVVALILYFYTACVVLCTYALTFEVRNVRLGVLDHDDSLDSRRLVEAFAVSDAFRLVRWARTPEEIEGWLDAGEIGVALVIPPGFEREGRTGRRHALQLLIDGANVHTATSARLYALRIVDRFERVRPGATLRPGGSTNATPVTRIWFNPDQRSASFMVLSMIALAGMLVGMMHPAASIVREKERGSIEQLLVTPVRVGELFVAKTAPPLLMGLSSVFPSLLIVSWFGVPMRGSLALFLALTSIFLLSAIALGVLVGSLCRTLQQALLVCFFGLFSISFLSGGLTPVESMPAALQTLSLASPLRHYTDIILAVFLKGAGVRELWDEASILVGIGAALFAASWTVFRRRML